MNRTHIIGPAEATLLNREGQFIPTGDWIQVLKLGEFLGTALSGEKFSQVIDEKAIDQMVTAFREDARAPNFPGLLIDRDHLSHYSDRETRAAGWVMDVQKRPDGLWAMPKWTPEGAQEVTNGIYRLVSPVLTNGEELGETETGVPRVRPGRFVRLAITNDPNIKGMRPMSNRNEDEETRAMNYKQLLCNMIGLAETATDEAITTATASAAARLKAPEPGKDEVVNRLTAENTALKADVAKLNKEVIEADVVKYRNVGIPEPKLREQLTANRVATVTLLDAILTNRKTGKDGEDGERMHNPGRRSEIANAAEKPKNEQERARMIETAINDVRFANRDVPYEEARNRVRRLRPDLFEPITGAE